MLKLARYLHGKFWLAMAWLVILLAVLLTAVRLLLPVVDLGPYKQDIVQIVETGAGRPIAIGQMHAELRGFRLALKFDDVSLFEPDGTTPVLHAREVHVDIELLHSLLSGRLRLGGAMVVGTRLQVERHADGSFSLHGLQQAESAEPSSAVTSVLLGQSRLRLYDSEILLKGVNPERPPLRLSSVAVDLLNDDNRHQLSVRAKVGPEAGETIRFVADLREREGALMDLDGRFYLQSDNLSVGGRLAQWLPQGYAVEQGALQVALWGDLQRGRLAELQGSVELKDLQVRGPAQAAPFRLDRLASDLDWRRTSKGWQVDLDRLVLVRSGQLWPPGRLSLAWQSDENSGRLLRMGADYLSLKELNDFLSIIKLPNTQLGDALSGLALDGHLTRFGFTLLQPVEGEIRWRVGGVVARYSNRPWESVPGLSGLRLSFDGNQSGGWLRIDSSDFSADFPRLFRKPINAKRLAGDFRWRFDTLSGLHLGTDRLEMVNEDVETLSRIEMQIPLTGKDLFVDMQTDFWNGDGSRKSDYLPVGIMPEPLVAWLDRAVVSGHVNAGSFLLYGPLKAFPFRQQEGRFEVWFGVEDLVLDYMPGWPRIEQGLAEAQFINNSLTVELNDGLLLGNRLRKAQARIRELRGAAPVEIEGEVDGAFDDMLKLLSETPLRTHFAPFVDAVEVGGKAVTDIRLSIPLNKRDKFKVEGTLKLADASMKVKPADLTVTHLTGDLQFDENQVKASGIDARLLGQPVSVDIAPKVTKQGRWTRISTHLALSAGQLKQQFPDWWLPPVKGETQSGITLEIAHQQSQVPVRLSIDSDLRGMAVALPEPLGKKAASSRPMTLAVDFRHDNHNDLRLRYNRKIRALVRLPAQGHGEPVVAIGFSSRPKLPASGKGYRITGSLDKLSLDQWIEWLGSVTGDGTGAAPPIRIDLRAAHLSLASIDCPKAHFTMKNFADGYRVTLDSDTVQGMVQVPGNLQQLPLLGRFDYMKLNLRKLSSAISGDQDKGNAAATELDPRELPSMDLTVDKLFINDLDLGKFRVTWQKEKDGITVTQLSLIGDRVDLSGQGYWRLTRKGNLTSFNLKGHVASLGELQKDLGAGSGIEGAPTDIKAELYWPSSPLDMGAQDLYGSIWLKVGKGLVKDVNPGVGRLIGLFSLNALGKRLALDFRDIFSKGLSFDGIEGNFTIQDGVAQTNDLVMKTTSARIDFTGSTGLVSRTYDQRVVVTPHLSATLPLVGALALNPTVGVALAVTQKLLGKNFDKMVQRTYKVTGSWDNPKFEQIAKKPLPAQGGGKEEKKGGDMGIDLPGRG
ncbi:MAG: YhdP family protein [Candidatus Thiodiazotropha sp.]